MSVNTTKNPIYRVVMDGYFLPGNDENEVVRKLGRLFGSEEEKIRAMFDGQPTVIKRQLTKNRAYQYLRTISNAGAACHIDKIEENVTADTTQLPVNVERTSDALKGDDILGVVKKRIQERNDFSEVMRHEIMEIDEVRRKSNIIILSLLAILVLGVSAALVYLFLG